ncbi:MAG: hopanoid biosynthesis associated radical SAM protein HpnJ [Candidatus Rifleibacteriota bacterium]
MSECKEKNIPCKPRVTLINPPFIEGFSRGQRSPAVTRSGTLYYPMWLAYAAAHAHRVGAEVLLVDAIARKINFEDSLRIIATFRPEIVVVETSTPSIESDLKFAETLAASMPDANVAVCGTHVSALPEDVFLKAPSVKAVIIGEYEIPLEELIKAVADRRPFDNLEGVYTRKTRIKSRSRYFDDLDARPFVSEIYKRFLPVEAYFNPNSHYPMVAVFTGRGCPFRCSFCVFPQTLTGHQYRKRSVDSIIEEFAFIEENLPKVRGVFIEDDTFTADPERVREFCEKFVEKGFRLSWSANSRADVPRELLEIMKKSGLRALCTGFETGSQQLLNNIGKGIKLDTMRQFAQNAEAAGVKVHGCFIYGLPGETRKTMIETLNFALSLPLDTAQFYPLMVYPGTRAYQQADKLGLITAENFRNWISQEDGTHNCVIRTCDCSSEEIVQFCNYSRRKFYLRKSWLARTFAGVVRNSEERQRVLKSAKTFLQHLWHDK